VNGTLSDEVIDLMYDRTGGVPLFVEEFAKMLQESAGPDPEVQRRARVANARHEIPSTLQDLVMARLDRLEGGRELAQLAAVLGREFSHECWRRGGGGRTDPSRGPGRVGPGRDLYAKVGRRGARTSSNTPFSKTRCTTRWSRASGNSSTGRIGEVLEGQFPQTAENHRRS